jgi:(p)ppGpp synthase/HD superfamily hydrolase
MTQLTAPFNDALTFAAELHASQRRKQTGIPYLSHLLAVAAIALEHGADEDEAIAALLHDAVEDQGGEPTLEAIRQRFGDGVADIVLGCSDTTVKPKPPWLERKQR